MVLLLGVKRAWRAWRAWRACSKGTSSGALDKAAAVERTGIRFIHSILLQAVLWEADRDESTGTAAMLQHLLERRRPRSSLYVFANWFYLGFLDTWNYRNLRRKFDDHASPWASPGSVNTVLREYKNAQGTQPSLIGTLVE